MGLDNQTRYNAVYNIVNQLTRIGPELKAYSNRKWPTYREEDYQRVQYTIKRIQKTRLELQK